MLDLEGLNIPYFVYGTLRPQRGNASIWRELGGTDAYDGEALVHGWRMKCTGIPYAIRSYDDEDVVVGSLVYPPDDDGAKAMLRGFLDSLEGHPNAYVRRRVMVWVPTIRKQIVAWIYDASDIGRGNLVPSGDYYEYRR